MTLQLPQLAAAAPDPRASVRGSAASSSQGSDSTGQDTHFQDLLDAAGGPSPSREPLSARNDDAPPAQPTPRPSAGGPVPPKPQSGDTQGTAKDPASLAPWLAQAAGAATTSVQADATGAAKAKRGDAADADAQAAAAAMADVAAQAAQATTGANDAAAAAAAAAAVAAAAALAASAQAAGGPGDQAKTAAAPPAQTTQSRTAVLGGLAAKPDADPSAGAMGAKQDATAADASPDFAKAALARIADKAPATSQEAPPRRVPGGTAVRASAAAEAAATQQPQAATQDFIAAVSSAAKHSGEARAQVPVKVSDVASDTHMPVVAGDSFGAALATGPLSNAPAAAAGVDGASATAGSVPVPPPFASPTQMLSFDISQAAIDPVRVRLRLRGDSVGVDLLSSAKGSQSIDHDDLRKSLEAAGYAVDAITVRVTTPVQSTDMAAPLHSSMANGAQSGGASDGQASSSSNGSGSGDGAQQQRGTRGPQVADDRALDVRGGSDMLV